MVYPVQCNVDGVVLAPTVLSILACTRSLILSQVHYDVGPATAEQHFELRVFAVGSKVAAASSLYIHQKWKAFSKYECHVQQSLVQGITAFLASLTEAPSHLPCTVYLNHPRVNTRHRYTVE